MVVILPLVAALVFAFDGQIIPSMAVAQ